MPFPVLFAVSVVFGLTAWGAVARQYTWNLKPILLLHGFRFLGLSFLVPGVVSPALPASLAQPIAYGDFLSAILALVALAALGTRTGTVLAWIFNVFGMADLLYGFYRGALISLPDTPGLLGAGYFILMAYVPLLFVTHVLAFRILVRR